MVKAILIVVLVISLLANIILGYFAGQLVVASFAMRQEQEMKSKVVSFTDLFVEKVLTASEEVNFETRLQLETMVRDLEDEEIFSQWQIFTEAKTPEDASREAKALLGMLVKKISK